MDNSGEYEQVIVSVCIQTYQHVNYIEQCIESVLMQKAAFPIEIIIGEDESDDGTRELCIEYANKYPHLIRLFLRSRKDVIYVNNKPTGRFNMMENLKEARGKYIALLEGDDYWIDPYKLQKQVACLEVNSDIIACHHWHKYAIKEKDNFIEVEAPKIDHGYLDNQVASVKNIFSNELRIKSRTILFRNVICDNFFPNWFKKVQFGDVPLVFLLGKFGKFYFLNEEMAVYRQTLHGSSSQGKNVLNHANWILLHYLEWIKIWDYANQEYKSEFTREFLITISFFYKTILKKNSYSRMILLKLLQHNFMKRKTSLFNKMRAGRSLVKYYRRKRGILI